MSDQDLVAAVREAIAAHPEGAEAGPTALLTAVKEAHPDDFTGVGIQKFKKVLSKVKTAIKEEEEQAKIEAAKPKVGSIENCPGKHGLLRFLTNHSSYCCDTCRCYVPEGSPMWGCRQCDWDVCEGRCHPVGKTLSDLRSELHHLEERTKTLIAEQPSDLRTKLALVEADIHKLEKSLDSASAADLARLSAVTLTEEEARTQKKALIAGTGALLSKLEGAFEAIGKEATAASAVE